MNESTISPTPPSPTLPDFSLPVPEGHQVVRSSMLAGQDGDHTSVAIIRILEDQSVDYGERGRFKVTTNVWPARTSPVEQVDLCGEYSHALAAHQVALYSWMWAARP